MSSLGNVRVFTQSAIRIEGADGTVAYFDPFALTGAEAAHDADYVLITHAHYDHLSPEDYARVAGEKTVVVAPASMAGEGRGAGRGGDAPHERGREGRAPRACRGGSERLQRGAGAPGHAPAGERMARLRG